MEDKESIFSDIIEDQVEGSYIQKLFYSVIDTAFYVLVIVIVVKFLPREITSKFIGSFKTYITVALIMIIYRLVCLLTLGRTIGMLICKLKYLNEKYQPLTTKEKFAAALLFKTSSIKYYKD